MQLTRTFAFASLVCVILFAGCKKDDVTAPAITLVGNDPMEVVVGTTFTDPGANAVDDIDGDVTSSVVASGTVDVTHVGAYTRTYNVADAAGNVGTKIRNVNVVMTRDAALGNYTTSNNCPVPYGFANSTFSAGSSANKIVIDPYYYNGGQLIVTIDGLIVTVDPGQAPIPFTDPVTGSGSFNTAVDSLVMNYTYAPPGAPTVTCSVTYLR